ncbi:putative leucine-rich repeat-containing protein 72-like [Trypanosoma rangeli]|uniref:Putative leucine-rich repeat-containing protein 72-like n=1 Tax=Trypanosoma rangeli TaxID=5698 RepID=A0A3R7MEW6_TRYRA|nr:putative leucine-rich repeat-containing protein 72-like [Trypanosoma rangeli]RNF04572.1 putative leucine-rich repeat-containing protein 72-like [Trypanosoma rangeli]|eukprot:RNF04572.1 putative leucine-rich repeat-containing protein 72-like [Trypanosoma rangeli]
MYTSLNRKYPDLLRKWHEKSLQGFMRVAPAGKGNSARRPGTTCSSQTKAEEEKEQTMAEVTSYSNSEWEAFPPYVDPTEEQEVCLDPIRALKIPRSRFHTVKELTLCCKGITRLHSNVQLLKNLDTLIIRHNRLRQIAFLIPPRNSRGAVSSSGAQEESNVAGTAYSASRGCRLLRRLYASYNCLQTLDGDVSQLRQLEVLFLAHNRLSDLSAVSAQLKPLRCLRELDLRGNPLCDEVGYRLFLIYEHPHLEVLDRRVVRDEERKEAATYFAARATSTYRQTSLERSGAVNAVAPAEPVARLPQVTSTVQFSVEKRDEEGGNAADPAARSTRKASFPPLCQQLSSTPSPRTQANVTGVGGKQLRGERGKSTVAFLRTYVPTGDTAEDAALRRTLFQPSACERLLEERVRRDNEVKRQRPQREARARAMAQRELQSKYEAFHATWALSRQGMPFSADKCEPLLKAMEALQKTNLTEAPPVTQRLESVRPRSYLARQQATEQTEKAAPNTVDVALAIDREQLPQLPPETAGQSDHSVMYDALLGRLGVVKKRIGQNHLCLPETRRLGRMDNVLSHVGELVQQPEGVVGGKSRQAMLMRRIQQEKDALVPEPWEHMLMRGQTMTMNAVEQLEYLYLMAMSFFLPTEFSALEGQFMTNAADALPVQEPSLLKKQTKKDKSRQTENARAVASGTASLLVTAAAALRQRLPTVLTATTVEVGPPERTTFVRVMNMLDDDSGIWSLDLDLVSEAFTKEYMSKNKTKSSDDPQKGEERPPPISPRRARRSAIKGRVKGERHGTSKFIPGMDESPRATSMSLFPAAMKTLSLNLSSILLDIVRYLPFVENRLAFFQRKCTETASKGVDGASEEAAREWFAKAQIASMHYERLMKALGIAGMTKEESLTRLVPLESTAMHEVQEVGSFFRTRAASSSQTPLTSFA